MLEWIMKLKWVIGGVVLVELALVALFAPTLIRLFGEFTGPGFGSMEALQVKQTRNARIELERAKDDGERCDPLSLIAKFDFNHGKIDEARRFATELLAIAPKIRPTDYDKPDSLYDHDTEGNSVHTNYGVALFDGNMVLGRIALREHRLADAKSYLLKSGMTPGACTLNSFGPNMSLAQDLLNAGQRDTVLQFFKECRRFWRNDKLDSWEDDVKNGGTPDFGGNMFY